MRDLRRLSLLLPAVVLACVCLSGCFEYKEVISLATDGSGTVEITASIPDEIAKRFRPEGAKATAPVKESVIRQVLSGSRGALIRECRIELADENIWRYYVVLEFDHIRSLSAVKYFKNRSLSLVYVFSPAKELHFRQEIVPSLVQSAKTEAASLTEDDYAKVFLAVVEAPNFVEEFVGDAKYSYEVVMPGISATAEGQIEILPEDFVRVARDFSYSAFEDPNIRQRMDIKAQLPAELGFLPLVMVLLLGSIVGMLIPAVRLIIIKSKGGA